MLRCALRALFVLNFFIVSSTVYAQRGGIGYDSMGGDDSGGGLIILGAIIIWLMVGFFSAPSTRKEEKKVAAEIQKKKDIFNNLSESEKKIEAENFYRAWMNKAKSVRGRNSYALSEYEQFDFDKFTSTNWKIDCTCLICKGFEGRANHGKYSRDLSEDFNRFVLKQDYYGGMLVCDKHSLYIPIESHFEFSEFKSSHQLELDHYNNFHPLIKLYLYNHPSLFTLFTSKSSYEKFGSFPLGFTDIILSEGHANTTSNKPTEFVYYELPYQDLTALESDKYRWGMKLEDLPVMKEVNRISISS